MNLDLSIVIVSYKCRDELADCLASLAPERFGVSLDVTVIDNASGDGTAEMVRDRFPAVRFIANDVNRGFAAANNQGIAEAAGRHLLFLNPDTVVRDGALEALVQALEEDESIGACGPQLVGPDGRIQASVRALPTFAALLHQYTPLRLLGVLRGAYRRYRVRDFDYTRAADVDALMGAALCVPRRVLDQVGRFDERFFVYFEEVDLCRRIRDAGYRNCFVPEATVTHVGGVSASRGAASLYLCRSMFRYLRKHNRALKRWTGLPALWPGMMVREAFQVLAAGVSAVCLALAGQRDRAGRRARRARSAAAFLFCNAWRVLLGV